MIPASAQSQLDQQVHRLAFAPPDEKRSLAQRLRLAVRSQGVYPASIHALYHAMADKEIPWISVPAMNLRGMTYDIARAVWRVVNRLDAGPVMFELSPAESEVCSQPLTEYTAVIQAAALREGFRGPVFFQGDHFRVLAGDQIQVVKNLCQEAVEAGMFQIDIDAAHMVERDADSLEEYQRPNAEATAEITVFARSIQPPAINLTLGGEVGEIGALNTTSDELQAFMNVYNAALPWAVHGLDKISAQTGTVHGGIVRPDGSIAPMPLDFDLALELSKMADSEYGLTGLVQHGASTLSNEYLSRLPEVGVIEVHLATQIQNIVFDHSSFPAQLLETIYANLRAPKTGPEGDPVKKETSEAQKLYHQRWGAWGDFKRELWSLEPCVREDILASLEEWFVKTFTALSLAGRRADLAKYYSLENKS